MKIAISAKIFEKMDIDSIIEESARIGYQGIEFRDNPEQLPLGTSDEKIKQVKRHLDDAHLAATSLASFTGYYADKDDTFCMKQLEDFRVFVQMASKIGAYNVRHWPGPFGLSSRKATESQFERAAEWMAKACDYAEGFGIKVAIELHHGTMEDTTTSALKLFNMINRKNLGFTPDNQNNYFDNEPYCEACVERLGLDKILNYHIKDVVVLPESGATPGSYAYNGRYFVMRPMNMGGVDQYGTINALKKIGYKSWVTIESSGLMTPLTLAEYEYGEVCKIFKHLGIERT